MSATKPGRQIMIAPKGGKGHQFGSTKYGGTSHLQADEGGIVRSVWDLGFPIIRAIRRSENFVFPNSDLLKRI
jgi:hypothetical protein